MQSLNNDATTSLRSPASDCPIVTAPRPTLSVSPKSAALAILGRGRSISRDIGADCPTVLLNANGGLRDSLKEIFRKRHITVIGEADDFRDLLANFQAQALPKLLIYHIAPNEIPEAALNMISNLRRHFPRMKLVALVDVCTTSFLSNFIHAGVNAVLLTDISGEMLLGSLELVLFGVCIFPPGIQAVLADNALTTIASERAPTETSIVLAATTVLDYASQGQEALPTAFKTSPSLLIPLSNRERQTMSCLAKGWSNKFIARELNIAETTVKVYLKCLSRKIRLTNRTQLAMWALRQSHLLGAAGIVNLVDTHIPQVELQAKAAQPGIPFG